MNENKKTAIAFVSSKNTNSLTGGESTLPTCLRLEFAASSRCQPQLGSWVSAAVFLLPRQPAPGGLALPAYPSS